MRNPVTNELLPYTDQCVASNQGKAGQIVDFFVPIKGIKPLLTPVDVERGDILPSDDEGRTLRDWTTKEKLIHRVILAGEFGTDAQLIEAVNKLRDER